MAGETVKATSESTELVEHGLERLEAAMGSLTTFIQGHTDATPFLLSIAGKFSGIKALLVQLRRALAHPCADHLEVVQSDLKGCMMWCQFLSERLLALARGAIADGGYGDSQVTLSEKERLLEGENPSVEELDVDKDIELLKGGLTRCIEACDCKLPSKQHRLSRRPVPQKLVGQFKRYTIGARSFLTGSNVGLSLTKSTSILAGLRQFRPVATLTPKCIAQRREATEARRRSELIDEQIKSDAKRLRTACMVPVYGSEEIETMVLEHFIARIANHEVDCDPATIKTIRHNVMRHVRDIMEGVTADEHSGLDESVMALAFEVYNACMKANGSGFNERFADYLNSLWSNPEVRSAYANSWKGGLECYGDLIVKAAQRVFKPSYRPTTHDCYRFMVQRAFTFHLGSFEAAGLTINFISSPRWARKRIKLYQDFACVLYAVDLASYCRPVVEDYAPTTNQLSQSIELFDSYINSRFFKNIPVLLVFTNLAGFRENMSTKPLSKYFPDFHDGHNPDAALEYILPKFTARNKTEREIYAHIGELTDSDMFEFIVGGVKDVLLRKPDTTDTPGVARGTAASLQISSPHRSPSGRHQIPSF